MLHPTDVLLVEKANGEMEILPAQEDHIRDQLFTQSMGYRLIKRCASHDEAVKHRSASERHDPGRWA
jgi:hypothetical protein